MSFKLNLESFERIMAADPDNRGKIGKFLDVPVGEVVRMTFCENLGSYGTTYKDDQGNPVESWRVDILTQDGDERSFYAPSSLKKMLTTREIDFVNKVYLLVSRGEQKSAKGKMYHACDFTSLSVEDFSVQFIVSPFTLATKTGNTQDSLANAPRKRPKLAKLGKLF